MTGRETRREYGARGGGDGAGKGRGRGGKTDEGEKSADYSVAE
jgi:hypothetical protein